MLEEGSTQGASPMGARHPLVVSGPRQDTGVPMGAHQVGLGSLASYQAVLGFAFSRFRANTVSHGLPPPLSPLPAFMQGKSVILTKELKLAFPPAGISLPFSL